MEPEQLRGFRREMEKRAISAGKTLALLRSRLAQGARVSPRLTQIAEQAAASGAKTTPAAARRAALGASEQVGLAQRAKNLPSRVGLEETARNTRSRVGETIRMEAKNPYAKTVRDQASIPLSKAYEGYMTDSRQPYTPHHISQVMGISKGEAAAGRRLGGPLGPKVRSPQDSTGAVQRASSPGFELPDSGPSATVAAKLTPKVPRDMGTSIGKRKAKRSTPSRITGFEPTLAAKVPQPPQPRV